MCTLLIFFYAFIWKNSCFWHFFLLEGRSCEHYFCFIFLSLRLEDYFSLTNILWLMIFFLMDHSFAVSVCISTLKYDLSSIRNHNLFDFFPQIEIKLHSNVYIFFLKTQFLFYFKVLLWRYTYKILRYLELNVALHKCGHIGNCKGTMSLLCVTRSK